MTRKECLEQAMECVLQDRNSQYGEPEDSFGMIAGMWTAYLGVAVDKVDVAMMMGMLKMARIKGNKHYGDGYIDLAGYAACAAECSGIGTEVPPWAKLVEAEAKEVEKAFGKPDGGCFQNGNDHSPEEPEFKPGEAVELWEKARDKWMPCVYLRKAEEPGYSIVESSDYRELLVNSFYLRKAEANHPENPDTSPEFKPGDRVEVRAMTLRDIWEPATVVEVVDRGCRVEFDDGCRQLRPFKHVRPVPKAEGCEELVQRIKDVHPAICGEKKEQD